MLKISAVTWITPFDRNSTTEVSVPLGKGIAVRAKAATGRNASDELRPLHRTIKRWLATSASPAAAHWGSRQNGSATLSTRATAHNGSRNAAAIHGGGPASAACSGSYRQRRRKISRASGGTYQP